MKIIRAISKALLWIFAIGAAGVIGWGTQPARAPSPTDSAGSTEQTIGPYHPLKR